MVTNFLHLLFSTFDNNHHHHWWRWAFFSKWRFRNSGCWLLERHGIEISFCARSIIIIILLCVQVFVHTVLFSCRLNAAHFFHPLFICQFSILRLVMALCASFIVLCAGVWWCTFVENEWQIRCIVACDQHLEFIFFVRCDYCIFFLFKTPSPTFIYITENREHKRAHIESCCLICVVVHVLIENNVFRIRNCTCRCVIVYVYVLCSNTNQIRWAETVVIVVGVVVAAVHCAITAKRQQIKQKLICLLTKDHTST